MSGTDTLAIITNTLAEIRDEYLQRHKKPWILGYSAGKDSTILLQMVWEMLLSLAPSDLRRDVFVISNDTLVESPLLAAFQRHSLTRLQNAAEALRVPITVHMTTPDPDQTFWVNVIGRGYRAPNRLFRWCTERLKINPTSTWVQSQSARLGEIILLLGVRSAESTARAQSIARYGEERLNPHNDLKNCLVFRPIRAWTTEQVWEALLQRRPRWGGSYRELITLYRNEQAGECPLVMDREQAPSCGSGSGRFGCWTCTVVEKDKSAEALADAGFDEYEHLTEFRDWLKEISAAPHARMAERRNGQIKVLDNGELMRGPFTFDVRQEILARLLSLQLRVGRELITNDEIQRIHRIWANDLVNIVDRRRSEHAAEQTMPLHTARGE